MRNLYTSIKCDNCGCVQNLVLTDNDHITKKIIWMGWRVQESDYGTGHQDFCGSNCQKTWMLKHKLNAVIVNIKNLVGMS